MRTLKALEIKKKHEDELLRIEGVVGVGADESSIRVYVEGLTEDLRKRIPQAIEGIPVKIIPVGTPILL